MTRFHKWAAFNSNWFQDDAFRKWAHRDLFDISTVFIFSILLARSFFFSSPFLYFGCGSNKLSGSAACSCTAEFRYPIIEFVPSLIFFSYTRTDKHIALCTMITAKKYGPYYCLSSEIHKSWWMYKVNLKQGHGTKQFVQFPFIRRCYTYMLSQSFWNQFIFWNTLLRINPPIEKRWSGRIRECFKQFEPI